MSLEHLSTALDADTRARIALSSGLTFDNVTAAIRAENVLLDFCVKAGMSYDETDSREWASSRVAKWMCAA